DLGGGTFDAAVLRRVEDGYRVVVAPRGLDRCGGEDFDRSVYRWFDGAAREEHGRSFDASDGSFNSPVLRACRMAKEALSSKPKVTLRGVLAGQRHKQDLDQATLEGLIDERIAATVRLSKDLADAADRRGHAIEHVLLIGGSSRIPLVTRQIVEALTEPRGLPEPLRLGATDFAVAMGAVYALVALDDMAPSAGSPWRVRAPGTVFRDVDAPWCPEMVVLPRGRFQMGSPEDEPGRSNDEGPRHWVEIGYDLAIGTCAVSFAEWDAYAPRGSERYHPFDHGWGRDDRPVINVSYEDVQHYLDWVNDRLGLTGREDRYRLPSEAEWEYACRGGRETPFWWGGSITRRQANYSGDYTNAVKWLGEYFKRTVAVRNFVPNPFGLYQTHGNVLEWCEDTWHKDYIGVLTDGSALVKKSSPIRILRGGSWNDDSRNLRSASRNWFPSATRLSWIGFRVARTLIS
ncbi:SUMF1/EgtB/PvdO family nonheme iron enzyme, partial [Tistrella mobilis]